MNYKLNPRIVCKDGFSMSVQANDGSYCLPRGAAGPHTHLEGGFPSQKPLNPELLNLRENEDGDPCDTVYPFVSRQIFEDEFLMHGGIVSGRLPD